MSLTSSRESIEEMSLPAETMAAIKHVHATADAEASPLRSFAESTVHPAPSLKRALSPDYSSKRSLDSLRDTADFSAEQHVAKKAKFVHVELDPLTGDVQDQALEIPVPSVQRDGIALHQSSSRWSSIEISGTTISLPIIITPAPLLNFFEQSDAEEEKEIGDPCNHTEFFYHETGHIKPGHCEICGYEGRRDEKQHLIFVCRSEKCKFQLCQRCHSKNLEEKGAVVKTWLEEQK